MRKPTLVLTLSCLLLAGGCDSLNLDPRDELRSDAVWEDPALIRAYLNQIYSATGYGFGNPMPGAAAAGETIYTHSNDFGNNLSSNITPDDQGQWDRGGNSFEHYSWGNVYASVRDLNTFLKNVEASEALEPEEKEVLLGEAYFLRAFFYHNLLRLYGGVPILTEPAELGADLEQYQVPRDSFAETVDFIAADLDRAAERLTVEGRRPGAATKGAALALKSRVLLFAASDLYNQNPAGELTGYMGGSQEDRWRAALDAAQAVIDLDAYELEEACEAEDYRELIVDGAGSGLIWARYFSGDGADQHNHSLWVSPNGYNSWTGDAPTQNHVDAYEMVDGSEFSWDNPDHAANPYENRDPRFHANVLYNGRDWRPRTGGAAEIDPRGVIQTGWYEMPDGSTRPGLDTREGPIQNWNGTRTGYNMAKFLSREVIPNEQQAFNPWIHIRYAEVLLNYAEAALELGMTDEALDKLNQVRARVCMPDVPADGGEGRTLMERIQREREIELAFEGHRYFDVRRWMIAPEVYTGSSNIIRITGTLDPDGELLINNRYQYEYVVQPENDLARAWDDKAYFLPIQRDEIVRNPALVQNPGYN